MLSENSFFVAFVVVRFCRFFFFCWAPVPMPGFIINASRFYLIFAQTSALNTSLLTSKTIHIAFTSATEPKAHGILETLFEKCLQYVCGIAHFSGFVHNIIICCVTLLRIAMEISQTIDFCPKNMNTKLCRANENMTKSIMCNKQLLINGKNCFHFSLVLCFVVTFRWYFGRDKFVVPYYDDKYCAQLRLHHKLNSLL